MVDIEKILMSREQFPIVVGQAEGQHYFRNIPIPPFHPSVPQEGLPIELITGSLLDKVIEDSIMDLEGLKEKYPGYAESILGDIDRDPETGKVLYGEIEPFDNEGVEIDPFPFIDFLYIGRYQLSKDPVTTAHLYIEKDPNRRATYFFVTEDVVFPDELKHEYEITGEGRHVPGLKIVVCNNLWKQHNIFVDLYAIVYKNLLVAINNAIVQKKYQQGLG